MKKIKKSIILVSLGLSMFFINTPQNVYSLKKTNYIVEYRELKMQPKEEPPVIYYSPHSDDETLQMGPSIVHNIELGREVIIVLLTDGTETGARELVKGLEDDNTIEYCRWHKKIHNPIEENYKDIDIDKKVVQEVRQNVEFYEACLALGVKQENIYIYSYLDKELKKEDAKNVITTFEDKYPNAFHNSMTNDQKLENHTDHYTVGIAAMELYREGKINNLNLFVKRELWKNIDLSMNINTVSSSDKEAVLIQKAISVYKNWDPQKGRYAFGYHSVPKAFDNLEEDKSSKYYKIER